MIMNGPNYEIPKFTLENFVHWLYTLMWSFFAAVNAMNATLCSMREKTGLCVLALFGCAFSIVNAMSAFSQIKESRTSNDSDKEV